MAFEAMATFCKAISCSFEGQFENLCRTSKNIIDNNGEEKNWD
jgi:hypothetical protein